MSIASEIERLNSAKENIKTAVIKRGTDVSDAATLDAYSQLIENCPYAINGSFTPEEDTDTFVLSGLNFGPDVLYISCPDLEGVAVDTAILIACCYKDNLGGIYYYSPTLDKKFALLKPTTKIFTWSQNGVEFKITTTNDALFKKGYTYKYACAGGFAQ